MNEQQPQVTAVDAPAERPPLAYGRSQLAALVIVQPGNVASIPPQVFACVTLKDDPNAIVALVGPESDLGSVQDAVVFSQAYAMRRALTELVDGVTPERIEAAKAVLEAASPLFLKAEGLKGATAEERLAQAREGYDPSQNPATTTGMTSDGALEVVVAEGDAAAPADKPPVH